MIKNHLLIWLTVLSVLFAVAGNAEQENTSRESDVKAIEGLYHTWNSAVETGSREKYLSILDDNIRMVPPGAQDIVGIKNYAQFLIPVFANAAYKITHIGALDIEFLGDDFAVARYDYIVDVTMESGVDVITDSDAALDLLSNNLKYNDVLRRQADGSWKVLRHMWNAGYARD